MIERLYFYYVKTTFSLPPQKKEQRSINEDLTENQTVSLFMFIDKVAGL